MTPKAKGYLVSVHSIEITNKLRWVFCISLNENLTVMFSMNSELREIVSVALQENRMKCNIQKVCTYLRCIILLPLKLVYWSY